MPLIKPRTHGKLLVRYICHLDREDTETLYVYAHLLDEPIDYGLKQRGLPGTANSWQPQTIRGLRVPVAAPRTRRARRRGAREVAGADTRAPAL